MPFADYKNFADCVSKNRDKDNPDAYCGYIKHQVEDNKKKKDECLMEDEHEAFHLEDEVRHMEEEEDEEEIRRGVEAVRKYEAEKGHYPWDKCIRDQKAKGYSKERAEKICGSIKAKSGHHEEGGVFQCVVDHQSFGSQREAKAHQDETGHQVQDKESGYAPVHYDEEDEEIKRLEEEIAKLEENEEEVSTEMYDKDGKKYIWDGVKLIPVDGTETKSEEVTEPTIVYDKEGNEFIWDGMKLTPTKKKSEANPSEKIWVCQDCGDEIGDSPEAYREHSATCPAKSFKLKVPEVKEKKKKDDEEEMYEEAKWFMRSLNATLHNVGVLKAKSGVPSTQSYKVAPVDSPYAYPVTGDLVDVAIKESKGFGAEINWFNQVLAEMKDIVKDANKLFIEFGWNSKEMQKEYDAHAKKWGKDWTWK